MDNNELKQQRADAKQQLKDAVKGAHEVLAQATTVFPFTLFPDTVTVDREKITVTSRNFFQVSEVVSIRIEDVLSIMTDLGPFMGSLTISTRFFNPDKPHRVNYLWRADAIKIKRLVQGYVIAIQKEIDCTYLGKSELVAMLDELGQAAPDEEV